MPEGMAVVASPVAGSVWKVKVSEGSDVSAGETLMVLEYMKMEIEVQAPHDGRVHKTLKGTGSLVQAGVPLFFIETDL